MSLNESTADLVRYRMQNSKEKLGSAKILLESRYPRAHAHGTQKALT